MLIFTNVSLLIGYWCSKIFQHSNLSEHGLASTRWPIEKHIAEQTVVTLGVAGGDRDVAQVGLQALLKSYLKNKSEFKKGNMLRLARCPSTGHPLVGTLVWHWAMGVWTARIGRVERFRGPRTVCLAGPPCICRPLLCLAWLNTIQRPERSDHRPKIGINIKNKILKD